MRWRRVESNRPTDGWWYASPSEGAKHEAHRVERVVAFARYITLDRVTLIG